MARQRRQYKDRIIEVMTFELRDNKGFTAHFDIEDHTSGKHVDITQFESPQPFTTESEALEWALRTAQQKVDAGYEKGTVVKNLRE